VGQDTYRDSIQKQVFVKPKARTVHSPRRYLNHPVKFYEPNEKGGLLLKAPSGANFALTMSRVIALTASVLSIAAAPANLARDKIAVDVRKNFMFEDLRCLCWAPLPFIHPQV
jgi:hypothetical protein